MTPQNSEIGPITNSSILKIIAKEWETLSTECAAALSEKDRRIAEFAERENRMFLSVYAPLLKKEKEYKDEILHAIKNHPEGLDGKKRSCRIGTVTFGLRTLPAKCIVTDEKALADYADKHALQLYTIRFKWMDAAIKKHWKDVKKNIPGITIPPAEETTFLRSDLLP